MFCRQSPSPCGRTSGGYLQPPWQAKAPGPSVSRMRAECWRDSCAAELPIPRRHGSAQTSTANSSTARARASLSALVRINVGMARTGRSNPAASLASTESMIQASTISP